MNESSGGQPMTIDINILADHLFSVAHSKGSTNLLQHA